MFSHFSKASYISNIQDKIHPKDDPSLFGNQHILQSQRATQQCQPVNQTDRLYMLFLYVSKRSKAYPRTSQGFLTVDGSEIRLTTWNVL